MKIIVRESYLTNITYLQVTGKPSCAMVGRLLPSQARSRRRNNVIFAIKLFVMYEW